MGVNNNVLVVVEQDDGIPKRVALELATKARQLADEGGGQAEAVALGPGAGSLAARLSTYGIHRVYVSEDQRFIDYPVAPQSQVIAELIREKRPRAVLFGATPPGKDMAARLAAELRLGVLANVIDIIFLDGHLAVKKPAFGGNIEVTSAPTPEETALIIVRLNAITPEIRPGMAEVEDLPAQIGGQALLAKVLKRVTSETAGAVSLEEAQVIVAGGRGLGNAQGFAMLEELARVLGGALGASRAAVDAGWISYPHQIGQTGKTVKPALYIACGISGAVQHKVGMQTSGTIVAINKSADAAIFQFADLGIVGDVYEVVPKLTEEIKKRKHI
ncbi:MAG: electron transfer flavoprotein subunit alpha/FixB family protein [Chloroflexi bacterium]|nr:electron transfer flavoprotein subunit alpha/FixB family protein [Chloroflexota bacterium]MCL5074845.1 electron transfer flavoprotein subunit alpha/FixB family protein [Chloroflexota bacterium]